MIEDLRELRENLRRWDADTLWMCALTVQCLVVVALLATGRI